MTVERRSAADIGGDLDALMDLWLERPPSDEAMVLRLMPLLDEVERRADSSVTYAALMVQLAQRLLGDLQL